MNRKIMNIMACMLLIILLIPIAQAKNQNPELDENQIHHPGIGFFIGRRTVYDMTDMYAIQVVGWIFNPASGTFGRYRGPLGGDPFEGLTGHTDGFFIYLYRSNSNCK